MSRWTVGDVCTTDVASVHEDTSFLQIVELIERYRVSGLPVVDGARRVVGVVSESDLLPKMEFAGGSRTARLFEGHRRRAAREKADGMVARDVMSAPAVTVRSTTSLVEAARRMDMAGVKRLPVVDGSGRLVGIVTRFDLLKVFLRADADIDADVRAELSRLPDVDSAAVRVEVGAGVVTLVGVLDRRSVAALAVRLAERVDGVVEVTDHLVYLCDDVEPTAVDLP